MSLPAILYSVTLFLGSFLLFLLEPLYAKLILPWFGGAASVWALSMFFFQGVLLLGYSYADLITRRLRPRHRAWVHIALLFSCLWFIPIAPHDTWHPLPGFDPTWPLLGLLATQIGLPFLLLSATSPLIQAWYSKRLPSKDPYVLFALSNAASFLALLSFPFLIEPIISSRYQTVLWSGGFVLFILLCSAVAWESPFESLRAGRKEKGTSRLFPAKAPSVAMEEKFLWIGLSACGSMLLLAVTNYLAHDVASTPLLWVLPLSLYLLSFVLVYSRGGLYSGKGILYPLAAVLVFLNYEFYEPALLPGLPLKILASCGGLFLACVFCHGELARRKPKTVYLTSYYLMISFGGAIGGAFVGLAAPHLFSSVYEYPLALILTAGLALVLVWRKSQFERVLWGIIALFLILILGQNVRVLKKESLVMVRNFYAALRVVPQETQGGAKYLTLCNGVVVHGRQFLDQARRREGTAYYSSKSGAALAVNFGSGAKKVGVIGLGVGTLATYGKAGDIYRFYEINPQVVEIAQNNFTFMRDSLAKVEVVLGDARLSLESETPNQFDVLAVDAFSGGAIPVHLLTREAFGIYVRHLKPEGVLAFHTSNLNLDLAPLVKLLANEAGYSSIRVKNGKDEEKLVDVTEWVLVTKNKDFVERLRLAGYEMEIPVPKKIRAWTDDSNSLVRVFR